MSEPVYINTLHYVSCLTYTLYCNYMASYCIALNSFPLCCTALHCIRERMLAFMHTYIHTHTHIYTHTSIHPSIHPASQPASQPASHPCMPSIPAYMHADIGTYILIPYTTLTYLTAHDMKCQCRTSHSYCMCASACKKSYAVHACMHMYIYVYIYR